MCGENGEDGLQYHDLNINNITHSFLGIVGVPSKLKTIDSNGYTSSQLFKFNLYGHQIKSMSEIAADETFNRHYKNALCLIRSKSLVGHSPKADYLIFIGLTCLDYIIDNTVSNYSILSCHKKQYK
ncbi:hypothetical protein QTP88_004507 [Uroleucon formosanum]